MNIREERLLAKRVNALYRHLKKTPRLVVSDCGKAGLWWSDCYLMLPMSAAVETVLTESNLAVEPGQYTVGRTVRPLEFPAVNMARYLPTAKKLAGFTPVQPLEADHFRVARFYESRVDVAWTVDGSRADVWTQRHLVDLVDLLHPNVSWRMDLAGDSKSLVGVLPEAPGKAAAVLMPIRTNLVETPWADRVGEAA